MTGASGGGGLGQPKWSKIICFLIELFCFICLKKKPMEYRFRKRGYQFIFIFFVFSFPVPVNLPAMLYFSDVDFPNIANMHDSK